MFINVDLCKFLFQTHTNNLFIFFGIVKEDSDSENGEVDVSLPRFRAIDDYETTDSGQVSFSAGDIILVVDQDEDGRPCKLRQTVPEVKFFCIEGVG